MTDDTLWVGDLDDDKPELLMEAVDRRILRVTIKTKDGEATAAFTSDDALDIYSFIGRNFP